MVFKNEQELQYFLFDKCYDALEDSLSIVYDIIDGFIKDFYADYTPEMYLRTYQLYCSLVKTEVVRTGNHFEGSVYFDYSSLEYITGNKPSGRQVMDAAAYGNHGASGLRMVSGETGVSIWADPVRILSKEAIEILKDALIRNGIPIK